MHQPGFGIDLDVGLGAEEILLALAGVPHVGVARTLLVRGRGWGGDDRGIHQFTINHPLYKAP